VGETVLLQGKNIILTESRLHNCHKELLIKIETLLKSLVGEVMLFSSWMRMRDEVRS
jgi:hypothetical protein